MLVSRLELFWKGYLFLRTPSNCSTPAMDMLTSGVQPRAHILRPPLVITRACQAAIGNYSIADGCSQALAQEEEAQALVDAMLEHNALELLVQPLGSLRDDNNDEAAAVFATLSIFENMIEVKQEVAELLVQNTKVRRITNPVPAIPMLTSVATSRDIP